MYIGSVYVGLKDSVFQHSTPNRHSCELYKILQSRSFSKPILFIYSDGGPDHRLTYWSVKLSLISLFLKLDLDYLCAARTAPFHSWRNPVERVMSILNLGLQCVGLARAKMPEELEKEVAKCSTIADIRSRLRGKELEVQDSLSPVIILLNDIFTRLKLHNEFIQSFFSATSAEISDFWSAIMCIDATLSEDAVYRRDTMKDHPKILEFINHCCQAGHYSFDILKCGEVSCNICTPIRLPLDVFKKLRHIPFPVPDGDGGHYLPFADVFSSSNDNTEKYRPSYKPPGELLSKRAKRKLSYYAHVQHAKNSDLMLQCAECDMWRLIFSKYKLKKEEREQLQILLQNFTYTCGSSLKELDLPTVYQYVDVRDHDCFEPIEVLYYSANNDPICIYCAKEQPYVEENKYPQCHLCADKPAIRKRQLKK